MTKMAIKKYRKQMSFEVKKEVQIISGHFWKQYICAELWNNMNTLSDILESSFIQQMFNGDLSCWLNMGSLGSTIEKGK